MKTLRYFILIILISIGCDRNEPNAPCPPFPDAVPSEAVQQTWTCMNMPHPADYHLVKRTVHPR